MLISRETNLFMEDEQTTTNEPQTEQSQSPVDTSSSTESQTSNPTTGKTPTAAGPDYDAELATRDAAIKKLTQDWLDAKNSSHLSKEETQKAQFALAQAVREREQIVAQKERQLAETAEQLETVSQATQTLSEAKTQLESELAQKAAKATKLEILTEEFPELLRYAKLIPASSDADEVRAACQALKEARTQDLESQRIAAVTGVNAGLPTNPQRTEPTTMSEAEVRNYLREASADPKEYERRRQLLLDRLQVQFRQTAS